MILKVTKDAEVFSYQVKRWNKMGNNFTATIEVPYENELEKGVEYTIELKDGNTVLYSEVIPFQDFIFQGYTDAEGKTVINVSDLNFYKAQVYGGAITTP